MISREAFIAGYCQNSGKTWDSLRAHRSVCRCRCDYESCKGWAMVPKSCVDDYESGGIYYEDGDPAPFDGPCAGASSLLRPGVKLTGLTD